MDKLEILQALSEIDTPSITNVVATYPKNPLCLGLYNPWAENWYTDQTVRCMYPELGARIGHAVTCVYGPPDPNFTRLSFVDVLEAMIASPQPTILAMEQRFPPELAGKVGLAGEIMTTAMQSVGCIGVVSNGPSRDIDAIRPLGFQYLLSGITAGHGDFSVQAVNVPVSISGMDVAPGEMIHMDENGACKFPESQLEAVLTNVRALLKEEDIRISAMRNAKSPDDVLAVMGKPKRKAGD